ncbi:MAG TPA: IgGFc-binding protein [Myxococcota bacterium]|jgi:hypothetical protein|nr:IgGFc-binding protein [Myxococcota bacterium]
MQLRVALRLALSAVALAAVASFATGCTCQCAPREGPGDSGIGDPCNAGARRCVLDTAEVCQNGAWAVSETCVAPDMCSGGICGGPCEVAEATRSYIGCHYYAVDLHNWDALSPGSVYIPQDAQFAVVVSAAEDVKGAINVNIYSVWSGTETIVASGSVFAGSTTVFNLPPDQGIAGPGTTPAAYRIEATAPITAYQFNPLNNTEQAFSNDASLLLPVHVLDTSYLAVTTDGIGPQPFAMIGPETAFVTVVATEDNTNVTITPTAPLRAGPGIPGGMTPVTATLNRYDVLNVESEVPQDSIGGQLSGTRVDASAPVAVFSGTVCSNMPPQLGVCCCDHTEEQVIPLSAWGEEFVVARAAPLRPANPEANYYRIVGGANGVTLSYLPATPPGAPAMLNQGDSVEFGATESFTVVSTGGPILVTQFLPSSTEVGTGGQFCTVDADCMGLGFPAGCFVDPMAGLGQCVPVSDPAMLIIPPVEQWRSSYVFLTPADYANDFATIIAPQGASVLLDGAAVTGFAPVSTVNGAPYDAATVALGDGTHSVESAVPVAVLVYGFDLFVSYSYAAGLNIEQIYIE